jgi:hypothetical protein
VLKVMSWTGSILGPGSPCRRAILDEGARAEHAASVAAVPAPGRPRPPRTRQLAAQARSSLPPPPFAESPRFKPPTPRPCAKTESPAAAQGT